MSRLCDDELYAMEPSQIYLVTNDEFRQWTPGVRLGRDSGLLRDQDPANEYIPFSWAEAREKRKC